MLGALLHKGALTISQIQEKVRLAGGSMTAGALLVGNAEEVIEKVVRYSEALGGISRLSFQMNVASLPHVHSSQSKRLAPASLPPCANDSPPSPS